MSGRLLPLLLLAATLALPRRAAATTELNFCDPAALSCAIISDAVIDNGSTLDFGNRPLTIKQGRKLDVGVGSMTIRAQSVTLEPGSALLGRGAIGSLGAAGGQINVVAQADILVQGSGNGRARIDLSAQQVGGSLVLRAGGNIEIGGVIAVQSTTPSGGGGTIDVSADGSVTVTTNAEIDAFGGAESSGGDVSVIAAGACIISGPIDTHGGDGGTIDVQTGDGISTGNKCVLDVSSTAVFGDAGTVQLIAGDTVSLDGSIFGPGSGSSDDGGGSGGELTISAGGNVSMTATVTLFGAAPDGDGGTADLTAGLDLFQTGPIIVRGRGGQGTGGSISLLAGRNATVGPLDATGGSFGAGDVSITAGEVATVLGEVNVDGDGGVGGTVSAGAEQLTVSGSVHTNGVGASGGAIDLQACSLSVSSNTQLAATGPNGTITLHASGATTVTAGASLIAGASNTFEYRPAPAPAPVFPAAGITPAPLLVINPLLPRCAGEPAPNCGNHVIDIGEECDDGNQVACDGCSPSCQLEPGYQCGDGVTNVPCGEQCDDHNTTSCDGCRSDCSRTDHVCGDGILECGEECDDHNTTGCDGCSALCRPDNHCGDGVTECGEECDDGAANGTAGDACSATCTSVPLPSCGDGVLNPGEECDDHNRNAGDGCSPTCRREICGNNVIDPLEQCDDANRDACDGCSPTCKKEICGNHVVDCGEQCDDGNTVSGDGCDSNCTHTGCGNGVRTAGEQCDDGNLTSGDGCDPSCHSEVLCPTPENPRAFCTPCQVDTDCDSLGRCAGRACVSHACASVTAVSCDDGRGDTRDVCVLDTGGTPQCQHPCRAATACDDGDFCNGAETCTAAGTCAAGTAPDCDDHDTCTTDKCDAAAGRCTHDPFVGYASIDCRLDAMSGAVAGAPPEDVTPPVRRTLGKLLSGIRTKRTGAQAAQATKPKKAIRLLRAANTQLNKLQKQVGKAQVHDKISGPLAEVLAQLATGTTDAVNAVLGELTP